MDKTLLLADGTAMAGLKSQVLTIFVLLALGLVLRLFARRKARQREGRLEGLMKPTLMARIADPLPADAALIAGLGTGGTARQSLDTQVLRPSPGLKLLAVIVVGMMLWFWMGGGTGPLLDGASVATNGMTPASASLVEGLALGAGLWSLAWTLTWELRWNRDEIVLTQLVFFRKTRRWRDLTGVMDSRHHDYVLTFVDGSRLRVLKSLTGIDGFLEKVAAQLCKDRDPRATRGR